ncbi:hypothetical protein [Roseibium sp. RKSG952]|uniref:hypothetical protein n=1 Tax=Roseibium sp. RKSG952 TaxID=2529384 RepID=UPI0012BBEA6D|nr:hypothetical protein [Roseibium sp. RKSG952]MTH95048.1 hypothetical protein [Roseibium sp. RKSG952]
MRAEDMMAEAASQNEWDQDDVDEMLSEFAQAEGVSQDSVLSDIDASGGHGRFADFLSTRALMGSAFDLDV